MSATQHWTIRAPLWALGFAVAMAALVAVFSPIAPSEATASATGHATLVISAGSVKQTTSPSEPPRASAAGPVAAGARPVAARLVRFGLTGGLALALVGALVVGRHRMPQRSPRSTPAPIVTSQFPASTEKAWPPGPTTSAAWPRPGGASRRGAQDQFGEAPRHDRVVKSTAEGRGDSTEREALAACARAVEAARRYDRETTRRHFLNALERSPNINPGAATGFWDMPSSGHADLARSYLHVNRLLDARTVLTVALITFRHNRELEALLRETHTRPA